MKVTRMIKSKRDVVYFLLIIVCVPMTVIGSTLVMRAVSETQEAQAWAIRMYGTSLFTVPNGEMVNPLHKYQPVLGEIAFWWLIASLLAMGSAMWARIAGRLDIARIFSVFSLLFIGVLLFINRDVVVDTVTTCFGTSRDPCPVPTEAAGYDAYRASWILILDWVLLLIGFLGLHMLFLQPEEGRVGKVAASH